MVHKALAFFKNRNLYLEISAQIGELFPKITLLFGNAGYCTALFDLPGEGQLGDFNFPLTAFPQVKGRLRGNAIYFYK